MNQNAYLNTNETHIVKELSQLTFQQGFNCTSLLEYNPKTKRTSKKS